MKILEQQSGRIVFNTGRQYAPEGQIITIVRLTDGKVWFFDRTRHIAGVVTCAFTTEAVMVEYDHCRYEGATTVGDEPKPYQPPKGKTGLQRVLDAAKTHGSDSEPDHEVGDLQDVLRDVWQAMGPTAKHRMMQMPSVKELLADWGSDLEVCPGDTVFWEDPDRSFSSGVYTVHEVLSENGDVTEDTIIVIKNSAGSIAEVLPHEITVIGNQE